MFEVDFGLILAQIINFAILFFIFKKFVSDSMNDLIDERKKLFKRLYKADLYYDKKVVESNIKSMMIIEDAHKEAKWLILTWEEIGLNKAQELVKKANNDVKEILAYWKNEVEKNKLMMIETMRTDALNLSIELNKKLFNNSCTNESFIDNQIKK